MTLLHIAAGLHAAADGQRRWPQAWQVVCDFIHCPDILGLGMAPNASDGEALAHVAERSKQALACTCRRSAPSIQDGSVPSRCVDCRALLPLVRSSLERSGARLADARGIALDAISMAVLVCDSERRLLHANAAASRELDAGHWLRECDGRLMGADGSIERRLAAALAPRAVTSEMLYVARDVHIELYRADGATAELMIRPVPDDICGLRWVLRLAIHGFAANAAHLDALSDRLRLTNRQRELAAQLLAGFTVTGAARRMGIVRGTANELLRRLFKATGTSHQTELVAYLMERISKI